MSNFYNFKVEIYRDSVIIIRDGDTYLCSDGNIRDLKPGYFLTLDKANDALYRYRMQFNYEPCITSLNTNTVFYIKVTPKKLSLSNAAKTSISYLCTDGKLHPAGEAGRLYYFSSKDEAILAIDKWLGVNKKCKESRDKLTAAEPSFISDFTLHGFSKPYVYSQKTNKYLLNDGSVSSSTDGVNCYFDSEDEAKEAISCYERKYRSSSEYYRGFDAGYSMAMSVVGDNTKELLALRAKVEDLKVCMESFLNGY